MERIVIGLDASSPSQIAVDWVIRRARHTPVAITLVTAFDSLLDDPVRAREHLIAVADRIRAVRPGSSVSIDLANASIHGALEQQSRRADLVVVGSHRSRPIRSMLAGGLPSRVAAQGHCPTVVVPDDWTPRDGAIVVGIGEDATSEPAIRFAVREAERRASELRIVHAWELAPQDVVASAALIIPPLEAVRDAHRELLVDAVHRLREGHPDARIAEHLVRDRPAAALMIDSDTAELIVIGTHHHEPEVGLLLGSIGGHLLRNSQVPICIVPEARESLEDEPVAHAHNWAAGIGDVDARVLNPLGFGSVAP